MHRTQPRLTVRNVHANSSTSHAWHLEDRVKCYNCKCVALGMQFIAVLVERAEPPPVTLQVQFGCYDHNYPGLAGVLLSTSAACNAGCNDHATN
jgi:hypothetical protein